MISKIVNLIAICLGVIEAFKVVREELKQNATSD